MLCVDEKTQVQALDRTQPVFPLLAKYVRLQHLIVLAVPCRWPEEDKPWDRHNQHAWQTTNVSVLRRGASAGTIRRVNIITGWTTSSCPSPVGPSMSQPPTAVLPGDDQEKGVPYFRHSGAVHDVRSTTEGEVVFIEIEFKSRTR